MTRPQHVGRRLALHALPVAALVVGAGSASQVHAAPGQVVSLEVTGPQSNAGKARRCEDVARRHGYVLAPQAPIHVTLALNSGYNRLVVTSARRGPVLDTPRPGWGMEQLCEDAMAAADRAYAQEGLPPSGPAAPLPGAYQPPPPQYQQPAYAAPQSGVPTFALDITGPDANPGKQQRCNAVAQRRGVVVNPAASLRAMLILQRDANRLQISSARRGEVYNQQKPGWGMEQLCEDAVQVAISMYHQDGAAPVQAQAQPGYYQQPAAPPPQPSRRPGYALGPIPPAAELAANVKALADTAVRSWQAAQFEQALASFREAERASHDTQFIFDQAVCEQRLGRFSEALAHTQQFLDRAPTSAYRPYAEQLFGELQGAMGNE